MGLSTELQRIRRNQRRRSRRNYFRVRPEAVTRCHWCRAHIVFIDRVRKSRRLSTRNSKRIVIEVMGAPVTFKLGTLDHVVPLAEGGGEDIGNLVPACCECNARRNNTEMKHYSDIVTGQRLCVDCGKIKNGRARRRCKECAAKRTAEYFAGMNGQAEAT